MIKNFSIIILLLSPILIQACGGAQERTDAPASQNQGPEMEASSTFVMPEVRVVQYESLLDILGQNRGDTVTLVNFWATWCQPCVKELPHFHEVVRAFQSENKHLDFIMVSIDKASEIERLVKPFLEKNKYQYRQLLLDDNGRMNEWIPKINTEWQGEIPATAVYKNGEQKAFVSGMISQEELRKMLAAFL